MVLVEASSEVGRSWYSTDNLQTIGKSPAVLPPTAETIPTKVARLALPNWHGAADRACLVNVEWSLAFMYRQLFNWPCWLRWCRPNAVRVRLNLRGGVNPRPRLAQARVTSR